MGGELAAQISGGMFMSTPHRVLNDSSMVRKSLIFFNNLDQDALIQAVPTAEAHEEEHNETCGQYVTRKLQSMRDHYEDGTQTDVQEPEWSEVVEAQPLV